MLKNTITGTFPVFIHANGPKKGCLPALNLYNTLLKRQREGVPYPSCPSIASETVSLEIITCSTYPPGETALEVSCLYWGAPLTVLRLPSNRKWKMTYKRDAYLHYLKAGAASRYYVCCDGDDVILARHPLALLRKAPLDLLRKRGAILAAEVTDWPSDTRVPRYPGRFPYGNGGGIFGTRESLIRLYSDAQQHTSRHMKHSDQYGVRRAAHALGYHLDTQAEYFQCLLKLEPWEVVLL